MMALAKDMTVQGELRYDEPMSRYTSWRVGGPADVFFRPASIEDLSAFLAGLDSDTPVFWHGVGSNLLVRDGGIRGVVVSASKMLNQFEQVDGLTVRAGVAFPVRQVATRTRRSPGRVASNSSTVMRHSVAVPNVPDRVPRAKPSACRNASTDCAALVRCARSLPCPIKADELPIACSAMVAPRPRIANATRTSIKEKPRGRLMSRCALRV